MFFVDGFLQDEFVKNAVLNRAFLHADGFFTSFLIQNGKICAFERHIQRLKDAAQITGLDYPENLSIQTLNEYFKQAVQNFDAQLLRCRVMIWRKSGKAYSIENHTQSQSGVWIEPYKMAQNEIHLMPVDVRKIPKQCLSPKVKWLAANVLLSAQNEALQKGGNLALMSSVEGFISEAAHSNIVWIQDGEWFTPSDRCDVLPGTTRAHFEQFLKNNGKTLHRTEISLNQLTDQAEYLCLNAIIGAKEVSSLNKRKISFSTETQEIVRQFNQWRWLDAYRIE